MHNVAPKSAWFASAKEAPNLELTQELGFIFLEPRNKFGTILKKRFILEEPLGLFLKNQDPSLVPF